MNLPSFTVLASVSVHLAVCLCNVLCHHAEQGSDSVLGDFRIGGTLIGYAVKTKQRKIMQISPDLP